MSQLFRFFQPISFHNSRKIDHLRVAQFSSHHWSAHQSPHSTISSQGRTCLSSPPISWPIQTVPSRWKGRCEGVPVPVQRFCYARESKAWQTWKRGLRLKAAAWATPTVWTYACSWSLWRAGRLACWWEGAVGFCSLGGRMGGRGSDQCSAFFSALYEGFAIWGPWLMLIFLRSQEKSKTLALSFYMSTWRLSFRMAVVLST